MSDISVTDAIVALLVLLASLSVHEWAHAWTAERLGDATARAAGRVTLNPLPHVDPLGTFILPGLLLLTGAGVVFGWAKPVPVNLRNFRKPVRDHILVAMAGPFSNFVICLASALVFGLLVRFSGSGEFLHLAVQVISINAILMVFNLIPIPPLDGSHVLRHLTGMSEITYMRFAQFGFVIVLGLLFLPPFRLLLGSAIGAVAAIPLGLMRLIIG